MDRVEQQTAPVYSIDKIASALSKAQADIQHAIKDARNPHFNSTFASLASVIDACRKPLADNGLAFTQIGSFIEGHWVLVTKLMHSSGQSIEGHTPILSSKADAQGYGSGMTYARRYGLAGIVGVAQSDDDADEASKPQQSVQPATSKAIFNHAPSAKGKLSEAQVKRLWAIAHAKGWSPMDVNGLLKIEGVLDAESLSKISYESVCSKMQTDAPPTESIPF